MKETISKPQEILDVKRSRVYKGHSWIKLNYKKSECTKCGLIREYIATRYEYNKNGGNVTELPDCI